MVKTITVTPQSIVIVNSETAGTTIGEVNTPDLGDPTRTDWTPYNNIEWEFQSITTSEKNYIHTIVDNLVATYSIDTLPINVESVTLDDDAETLAPEAEFQLTATVLPADATNKSVTWASDDEEVATVDAEWLVTAVADGTCTITVTTVDWEFTAECDITVAT